MLVLRHFARLIVACVFTHVASVHANAQTIGSMTQELAALEASKQASFSEIQKIEENVSPKRKEISFWNEEVASGGMNKDRDKLVKREREHNASAKAILDAIQRHNIRCQGSMPPATYQQCMNERAPLQARDRASLAQKTQLEKDVRSYNGRHEKVQKRVDELTGIVSRWETTLSEHRRAMAAAEARIYALLRQLEKACSMGVQDEDLHLCNSVRWDGANPTRR